MAQRRGKNEGQSFRAIVETQSTYLRALGKALSDHAAQATFMAPSTRHLLGEWSRLVLQISDELVKVVNDESLSNSSRVNEVQLLSRWGKAAVAGVLVLAPTINNTATEVSEQLGLPDRISELVEDVFLGADEIEAHPSNQSVSVETFRKRLGERILDRARGMTREERYAFFDEVSFPTDPYIAGVPMRVFYIQFGDAIKVKMLKSDLPSGMLRRADLEPIVRSVVSQKLAELDD